MKTLNLNNCKSGNTLTGALVEMLGLTDCSKFRFSFQMPDCGTVIINRSGEAFDYTIDSGEVHLMRAE